ncbi:hypothetical protein HDU67_003863 [Dinochytrium kinnereticum]|nr:hypothetical protein HDU67_003863 [Dinochytrium kinnereticum]
MDPSSSSHIQDDPSWYKPVGITLALASGFFIGSSFIFKKRGLLDSQAKHGQIGTGHSYLSSPLWWTGMILMALGEVANFGAYAFVPAILVTPLGALSVVISAVLSSIFLKERLNFSGKIGCAQCLLGATIIVMHAPESNFTETIPEFLSFVMTPGFLIYCFVCTAVVLYLIYYVSPQYGDKNPLVYIAICSTVGSFLVVGTQGFGSCVVYTTRHWKDGNQFLYWQIYPLFAFIVFTVIVQIHFLNKALNLFSTAIVTPVYYVFFTAMTLISSAVLFKGFSVTSTTSGVSLVFGFLVIVGGVAVLFQYQARSAKVEALKALRMKREKRLRVCEVCKGSGRVAGEGCGDEEDGDDGEEEGDEDDEEDDEDVLAVKKTKKLGNQKTNFKVLASNHMEDSPTTIINFHQAKPISTTTTTTTTTATSKKPPPPNLSTTITGNVKSAAAIAIAWVKSPTSTSPSHPPNVPWKAFTDTANPSPPITTTTTNPPPKQSSASEYPPSSIPKPPVPQLKPSSSTSFQRVTMTTAPPSTAFTDLPPVLPPPPKSHARLPSNTPLKTSQHPPIPPSNPAPTQSPPQPPPGQEPPATHEAGEDELGSAEDLGVSRAVPVMVVRATSSGDDEGVWGDVLFG